MHIHSSFIFTCKSKPETNPENMSVCVFWGQCKQWTHLKAAIHSMVMFPRGDCCKTSFAHHCAAVWKVLEPSVRLSGGAIRLDFGHRGEMRFSPVCWGPCPPHAPLVRRKRVQANRRPSRRGREPFKLSGEARGMALTPRLNWDRERLGQRSSWGARSGDFGPSHRGESKQSGSLSTGLNG